MLTAVVCGEIFASPSSCAVLKAIQACANDAGVLLIVKNYTGKYFIKWKHDVAYLKVYILVHTFKFLKLQQYYICYKQYYICSNNTKLLNLTF